ncbi:MAG: RNA repair domain-containing protein [Sulfolobales archaeon]|nr:RNA repair domain-containing protein [Sulfolobales archaeon]MDW8082359.1 RNA repair domain-containing protein [Sulfolobales archaeon]
MGRLESYEVLKKLFWMSRVGELILSEVEIVVVDRNTVSGVRSIKLSNSSILMKDRVVLSESNTQIPIHRIVEIKIGGESLWRKKQSA